jgi:hypothetical protein
MVQAASPSVRSRGTCWRALESSPDISRVRHWGRGPRQAVRSFLSVARVRAAGNSWAMALCGLGARESECEVMPVFD